MTAPLAPAPGYYPDPLDPAGERWWNGTGWTDTVRSAASQPGSESAPESASASESESESESEPDGEPIDPDLVVPLLAPDIRPVQPRIAAPVQVATATPTSPEPVAATAGGQAAVMPTGEPSAPAVPAGYYPDPYGQAPLRWWDGTQWTVQTSAPDAVQSRSPVTTAAGTQPASSPADEPAGQGPRRPAATVLPATARAGSASGRPGFPVRTGSGFPLRSIAAVLVLLVGIGVRAYFWFESPSDPQAAASSLAASVNLRPADLPKGFVEQRETADTAPTDGPTPSAQAEATVAAAQREFDQAVNRCIGATDSATSVAFAAASPTFARAGTEVSSDVSIVRSEALAVQDLRAHQSASAPGCVGKVGTKPLRTILNGRGVTLTALSVTTLPGVPKDAFGLRTRMTMAANGRTMTVFSDTYGFVRRNVEVGLTVSRAGAAPDPVVAAGALRQLQARTDAALPGGGDLAG